jgi:Methyl-accepting chemotaxis protein (MCP) signalling domain
VAARARRRVQSALTDPLLEHVRSNTAGRILQAFAADVDLICRDIGLVVSPVRTTSFEVLSYLMLAAFGENDAADAEALDRLLASFTRCEETLRTKMAESFALLDTPMPEDLEAARLAALAANHEIHRKLRSIAGGYMRPTHATFYALAREIDEDLRPAVAKFLAVLNEFARRESQRRQAETRGIVAKTIAEIGKISLSIKLISINASVEAAHAGDAGKGFAVIATEIRSLSSKAQEALDGIKSQLI